MGAAACGAAKLTMRICLLTRHFGPSGAGIGRVSWEIWQGLQDKNHEIVGVSTSEKSLASYLIYSLVSIRPQIPEDYDVYHALTPIESLWIPKSKAVVTFHDLFPLMHKGRQGAGIGGNKVKQAIASRYFGYCAKAATRCRIIACNSEQTRQDIVQYLRVSSDRVRVVKLGIPDNLEPQSKPDSVFRIGYLGQLDRRKRVHLLVDAFKRSSLNAELVVGGTGPERQALERLAGGDPRVKFLGFVPEVELADFYNSLDVFVFPTAVEGYGLPIIEAMACMKPVIVLGDAVIPEEVKSRCIVTGDLPRLLDKLDGIGLLPSEGNYAFAKEHSWSGTVSEYIKLYEEVLQC